MVREEAFKMIYLYSWLGFKLNSAIKKTACRKLQVVFLIICIFKFIKNTQIQFHKGVDYMNSEII